MANLRPPAYDGDARGGRPCGKRGWSPVCHEPPKSIEVTRRHAHWFSGPPCIRSAHAPCSFPLRFPRSVTRSRRPEPALVPHRHPPIAWRCGHCLRGAGPPRTLSRPWSEFLVPRLRRAPVRSRRRSCARCGAVSARKPTGNLRQSPSLMPPWGAAGSSSWLRFARELGMSPRRMPRFSGLLWTPGALRRTTSGECRVLAWPPILGSSTSYANFFPPAVAFFRPAHRVFLRTRSATPRPALGWRGRVPNLQYFGDLAAYCGMRRPSY